jgi:ATP-dependent RNA helicase DDX31/DBP7
VDSGTGEIVAPAEPATATLAKPGKPGKHGGWKARREAAVRARPRARPCKAEPRSRTGPRGRTAGLVHDEFDSGIGGSATGDHGGTAEGEGKLRGAGKKRARLQTEVDGDVGQKEERLKREKWGQGNVNVPVVSDAAIAATFGVIGGASKGRKQAAEVDGDVKARVATSLTVGSDDAEEDVAIDSHAETAAKADAATSGGLFNADPGDFEGLGLYPSVARHLVLRLGIERPTLIQERMLRLTLPATEPIDVLVRSQTGSGKTLSYCLPIAHFLLNRPKRLTREDGSLAIIVVPTRELAEQVEDVATRLFRPWHWIVVGSLRGGENKKHEKDRLRKGISVLVATPGRLVDHIRNTKRFDYSACEFLVLDEADRLLDLGFEADIKEFIKSLNAMQRCGQDGTQRCNFLLSATLNNDVKRLAELSLKEAIEVNSAPEPSADADTGAEGDTGTGTAAVARGQFAMPERLRQHFCIVEQKHRLVTLGAFLRLRAMKGLDASLPAEVREKKETIGALATDDARLPVCKIIVFFSTCDSVDFHHELFEKLLRPTEFTTGIDSCLGKKLLPLALFRIHGTRSQPDRVAALRGFRNSRRAVLFCTDVAARGLDLKGVTFAIQYDPPTGGHGEELEYLHRAGRTARIGERGDALIFLLPSEKQYVRKLESAGASMMEISSNAALAALLPRAKLDKRDDLSFSARVATSALQETVELPVRNDEQLKALAYTGFRAYCRAYATHARETKHFFHVRNLHLGHVARSFAVIDQPGDFKESIAAAKKARREAGGEELVETEGGRASGRALRGGKGDIARAIADGSAQPYNDQRTTLAKRRREGGRGQESFRELASEFGS